MKWKTKIKDSHLVVKTKISSDEEISERELDVLNKQAGRGFLISWASRISTSRAFKKTANQI